MALSGVWADMTGVMVGLADVLDDIDCECGGGGYPPRVEIIHGEQPGEVMMRITHEPHCLATPLVRDGLPSDYYRVED